MCGPIEFIFSRSSFLFPFHCPLLSMLRFDLVHSLYVIKPILYHCAWFYMAKTLTEYHKIDLWLSKTIWFIVLCWICRWNCAMHYKKKYPYKFFFGQPNGNVIKCLLFQSTFSIYQLLINQWKKYLSNVSNKTGKYSEKLKIHLWDFCA